MRAANDNNTPPALMSRTFHLAATVALGLLATGAAFAAGPESTAATSTAPAEGSAPPATSMPSFAGLVERLRPAVVSVYVDAELTGSPPVAQGPEENPIAPGSPFEFFFRQFGERMPTQHVRAQGSGFFIAADGYLMTNNHVVEHAKRVQITTTEGKTFDVRVVGTDPKTDLAVLKVTQPGTYPFAKFASTLPKVGDWVLVMGNPFGLGGTVTAGIVSATGRDIGAGPYSDYLQIDAPVNKGNSGGPSFNMQGDVVGVNAALYSPSGGSVGIGFDIPATVAKSVADQLMTKGVVSRGWIGVMVQPVTADIAAGLGLKEPTGALIDEVQPNGPAAKAGLRNGDVVLSVDGGEVKDARDLARRIAAMHPDKTVTLKIVRNASEQTLTIAAAAYPSERQQAAQQRSSRTPLSDARVGLYLAPANAVQGAGSQGVVVVAVDPNGVAAEKGLQQGDVILDAGGKSVSAPQDVSQALDDARKAGKPSILLRVRTAENTRYVALPVHREG